MTTTTESKKIRVLVVDTHELLRKGIASVLSTTSDIFVIGVAGSILEAIEVAHTTAPHVVLMDLRLCAHTEGLNEMLVLMDEHHCKIIVLAASGQTTYSGHILQSGISGYLTKDCGRDEMIYAIRCVMSGEHYMTALLAQKLALHHLSTDQVEHTPFDALSERELQVLIMLVEGLESPEIARKMGLSSKTVNTYRYRLFEKLGVESDVGLIRIALRHHLIDTA